ncbi:MAG TPA: Hpt domain-containing protein [Rheinheimera sp.]|uniref:Hpt domain-containing protein n=1 Tax=Rheinheimera sp. TaxID=1869214 RepID=UPI002F93A7D4
MALINHTRLQAVLSMSQQHQPQLIRMISTLLADAEKNISQIQSYAQAQQRQELQQTLHKIRGGYATLGAEDLAHVSKTLELALEQQQPISEADLTGFISIYRQSCAALQQEITKLQSDVPPEQAGLDLVQLYYLLRQQDMQACALVQNGQDQLKQLLTTAVADNFSQQVFALNFTAAAVILQPFLPAEHRSNPK